MQHASVRRWARSKSNVVQSKCVQICGMWYVSAMGILGNSMAPLWARSTDAMWLAHVILSKLVPLNGAFQNRLRRQTMACKARTSLFGAHWATHTIGLQFN